MTKQEKFDGVERVGFFCTSPSWGGLEINILRLAGWLTRRGLPVTILARANTPLHREATGKGLGTVSVTQHRKYFDFRAAALTAALLKKSGITVMFVFHRNDTDVAAWTRFFAGRRIRLVYQQQMRLGVSRRDPVHALRYRAFDAWIAPLDYLRNEVLALTTVPERKIHVIPLGIDCEHYRETGATNAGARKFFGLGEGSTIFGIIGRIEPGKGQAFLVRALDTLRGRGRRAELLVVGDVTIEPGRPQPGRGHTGELRDLVSSLGLQDAVRIHPFVQDSRLFYRAVDAFVMATPEETYGMVTLEAMASGIPVVASNRTSIPEVCGKAAILVDPSKPFDMAVALSKIIHNRGLEKALISKGLARASLYSWEKTARKTLAILEGL